MLTDYTTYFDICQLIFSELSIKIIRIQEQRNISHGTKLQQLIDLLVYELDIDLDVDGHKITRFNMEHIHKFLEMLY